MTVRTTVAGSWWVPEGLEAEAESIDRASDEAKRADTLDRIAAAAIAEQCALGLDEWTGGEFWTDDFSNHLPYLLEGVEVLRGGVNEQFDIDDVPQVRFVGDVAAPNGLGYAEHYLRERLLPGGVRKATVVGADTIAFYEPDPARRKAQEANCVAVVNAEVRQLAEAGCPHVQIDCPGVGVSINSGAMSADEGAELIAGCFEGVTGTIRGVHLCNGNLKGRPASPVLRNSTWVPLLERLEGVIDVAHVECQYFPMYLEREAYATLPPSIQLAAGIVDEANYWVEPVTKIRERIADWARVVGEERLWVSPSCGFGRHPLRDRPTTRAKVENMVEAARSL